jgi:hypothetical protein
MKELKVDFDKCCSKLGHRGIFRTSASHDGSPHVEKNGDEFHWIVTERGSEFQRRTTRSRNEVVYWLVSDEISSLSIEYEFKSRIEGQDFRRVMFGKRIELMNSISRDWGIRLENEIKDSLDDHPYNDGN